MHIKAIVKFRKQLIRAVAEMNSKIKNSRSHLRLEEFTARTDDKAYSIEESDESGNRTITDRAFTTIDARLATSDASEVFEIQYCFGSALPRAEQPFSLALHLGPFVLPRDPQSLYNVLKLAPSPVALRVSAAKSPPQLFVDGIETRILAGSLSGQVLRFVRAELAIARNLLVDRLKNDKGDNHWKADVY